MAKGKPKKGSFIGDTGEREEDVIIANVPSAMEKKQKSVKPPEYPRGIKKIASYSGVTRVMKCADKKCGGFDEIVNIYVYPEGAVTNYPDDVVDRYTNEHNISKHSVRNHGFKELSIWGKKEAAAGSPYDEMSKNWVSSKKGAQAAPRHKKRSKPVKRIISAKRGNTKR
jgi:hypothetical protein